MDWCATGCWCFELMDIEAMVLAAVIVVVTTIGMRVIYGYWPWRKPPRRIEAVVPPSAEVMQQDLAAAFREHPPFQPFSEKEQDEPQADAGNAGNADEKQPPA